nr:helix-turn-helix domain-containing protein [Providencia sp. G1(2023)]
MTEVAFDLGYSNVGSFSTMFKRWLGQSPSSFIQRISG